MAIINYDGISGINSITSVGSSVIVYNSSGTSITTINRDPDGTESNPFGSPEQAKRYGFPDGTYWFKWSSGALTTQMEYRNNYYENVPMCCVFRSPFASTATTNLLDRNIPMAAILVQRDALDIRALGYFSSQQLYNTTTSTTGITIDSGYISAPKVLLGYAGGHGFYNTSQTACNWSNSASSIAAGFDGSCGTFPNALRWGTGQSGSTYANMSGTWSHWIYWIANAPNTR